MAAELRPWELVLVLRYILHVSVMGDVLDSLVARLRLLANGLSRQINREFGRLMKPDLSIWPKKNSRP